MTDEERQQWVADYEAEERRERAEALARLRMSTHGHQAGAGTLRKDDPLAAHRAGARGEVEFAARYGLPLPIVNADGAGDGGIDFRVMFPRREVTFDIKTRDKEPADLLMVPVDCIHSKSAELFVFGLLLHGRYRFIGWEHKSIMTHELPRDFGYNRPTYARPIAQLRPMDQLDYLFNLRPS